MDHRYNASIICLELLQENIDVKAGLLIQKSHLDKQAMKLLGISIHK